MDDRQGAWSDEARARWGDTTAYVESAKRVRGYGPRDWEIIKGRQEENEAAFAEAMAGGEPAHSDHAVDLAEEARLLIDRWFYPCSRQMHAGLAELYTTDVRFRAHYDDRVEGLATYVAQAIAANLARA